VLVAALLTLALSPVSAHAAAALAGPVFAAVGDIACDPSDANFNGGAGTSSHCGEMRTSDVAVGDSSVTGVLGLGDYQYNCGDPADYAVSYNPSWGRLKAETQPVAGNHEYITGTGCPTDGTAASFFNYFGANSHQSTKGHFSFDAGSWHLIALNANCSKAGGCGATSVQTKWLQADLAATSQPCILAFWHQPLFTGQRAQAAVYRTWWNVLYAAHADVVLNGHVHNYQRYVPLNPSGASDPVNGITEYIVGTGGEGLNPLSAAASPQPAAWNTKSFGYLRLALNATGWTSQFVSVSQSGTSTVSDTSAGTCHI
jgi:hypothetical protein